MMGCSRLVSLCKLCKPCHIVRNKRPTALKRQLVGNLENIEWSWAQSGGLYSCNITCNFFSNFSLITTTMPHLLLTFTRWITWKYFMLLWKLYLIKKEFDDSDMFWKLENRTCEELQSIFGIKTDNKDMKLGIGMLSFWLI